MGLVIAAWVLIVSPTAWNSKPIMWVPFVTEAACESAAKRIRSEYGNENKDRSVFCAPTGAP